MKKKDRKILCEGVGKDGTLCPVKDHCAWFCVGFDKDKTDHFAWAPFRKNPDRCYYYEERDIDSMIINSLNKN
jgi:hypothetical protein